jgi:host cell surface-exposed lipoprotein
VMFKSILKWGAAGFVALIVLGAIFGSSGKKSSSTSSSTQGSTQETTQAATPTQTTAKPVKPQTHKAAKPKPKMTAGQREALDSARSYIEMSGFSKRGLIQQLSSSAGDGFSKSDATYAAKHVGADWKHEAVESARSYMDMGGFSRQSLMTQLTSSAGEKFTQAQASYAVSKVYR